MGRRSSLRSPRCTSHRPFRTALVWTLLVLLSAAAVACRSTPVAKQAAAGNAGSVRALLEQGASPDGTDRKRRRAIELAVHFQRVEVVRVLAAGGADVRSPISRGMSPLHYAAMRGNAEIVRILMTAGAPVDVADRKGYTPLGRAIGSRQWQAADALVAGGGRLATVRDQSGADRALLHAALKRQWTSAAQLLRYGANPETAHRGRSVRQIAADSGNAVILAALAGKAPPSSAPLAASVAGMAPQARLPQMSAGFTPPSPAMSPPPPGLDFGRYHALVIGNNDYKHLPKLRTAMHDADAVAELLRGSYGHQVTRLSNASRADILRALAGYRRTLAADDNLLIYYAGHGWLDEEGDRGYWLPVDATRQDVVNWVDNGAITSAVRAMQAKHVLVVADSCYSANLTRGIHIVSKSPNYIERLATRRARVVLTSGGLEPVLDSGGKGQHSVFASAFLDVLEENRGVLEGHELFTRIRRPVAVNSDQVPHYSDMRKAGHDGGDFLFVRRY